ncbi:MAG: host attachment family protein [Alphaproteobacteria bacterium]
MIKKTVTWYLVADGARARLFANDGPGRGLHPATDKTYALDEVRRTQDIVSDREGRGAGPAGGSGHAMTAPTDPRAHEEAEFVRHLAGEIGEMGQKNQYDRLVIVAAPQALGALRAHLPRAAQDKLIGELNKDLTQLTAADITQHLEAAGLLL